VLLCEACNTDVQLGLERKPGSSGAASTPTLTKLSWLASWLAKRGALVDSMAFHTAHLAGWQIVDADTACTVNEATVQLLCRAMQKAAAPTIRAVQSTTATGRTAAIEAATTAAGGERPTQQQLPRLRLARFSSDAAWAVGLLPVLPAHSLTCLELGLNSSRCPAQCGRDAAALAAALPRLSSLQQLVFKGDLMGKLDSCMSLVGQLSKLTSLELMNMEDEDTTTSALQQLLLQPPPLQVLHVGMDMWCCDPGDEFQLPQLDMGGLQQLQEFTCEGILPQLSMFPVQLQHLKLGDCIGSQQLAAVMPLQQLKALHIDVAMREQEPLRRLAQLPALQHLRLVNSYHEAARLRRSSTSLA
jgi:hypothetical protein